MHLWDHFQMIRLGDSFGGGPIFVHYSGQKS